MGSKKKKMKKEVVSIPKDWWAKCEGSWCEDTTCLTKYKGKLWCAEWSDKLTAAQKRKLNCGHPFPDKLSADQLYRVHFHCGVPDPPITRPLSNITKACIKSGIFLRKLEHRYECQKPPRKRAANLDSDHSGKLAVGLAIGILLFLLLLGVIAYWYFRGRQKSGRPPKGASKGGSKTGKSKLGKSKLGSRKSSQRSSHKGSLRSKATKSTKKK